MESKNMSWEEGVAGAMVQYLRRDQRHNKVLVSLSDSEQDLVIQVAKKLKKPKAAVVRAAALLGLSAYAAARIE